MIKTEEDLKKLVTRVLGESVTVHKMRLPGLYGLHVPAYLDDNDGVGVYVKLLPSGRLVVTDMATTVMRLSFTMEIDDRVDEALTRLAKSRDLEREGGQICAYPDESELAATVYALIQTCTVAEATIEAEPEARGVL